MTLEYLDRSDGWEVGVGPSIVVVDTGMGKALTTTTLRKDVYASSSTSRVSWPVLASKDRRSRRSSDEK
jgi:hypothetical protein